WPVSPLTLASTQRTRRSVMIRLHDTVFALANTAEKGCSPPRHNLTLHQLRHSALTHAAEDGTNTPILLARSRHTSVRFLERYARPGPEAVARHLGRARAFASCLADSEIPRREEDDEGPRAYGNPLLRLYRSRNWRAFATNCPWNWKMPPWPASE